MSILKRVMNSVQVCKKRHNGRWRVSAPSIMRPFCRILGLQTAFLRMKWGNNVGMETGGTLAELKELIDVSISGDMDVERTKPETSEQNHVSWAGRFFDVLRSSSFAAQMFADDLSLVV